PVPSDLSLDTWKQLLDNPSADRTDPDKPGNALPWQYVREQPNGVLATGYGLLVGKQKQVLEVLQDDGRKFSVCGYGERMKQSLGIGFLGMDRATGHDEQAEHTPSVNEAIEDYKMPVVFAPARQIVDGVIAKFSQLALMEDSNAPRV